MADVEETVKKIQSQKGVEGVIIANSDGVIMRSTLDDQNTLRYAALIQPLLMKAKKMLWEMNPQDEFSCLRLRTDQNEIIVTADKDYFMVGIQKPSP